MEVTRGPRMLAASDPEGPTVTNPQLASEIRNALLASPYIEEVLQVRTVEVDGHVDLVGVRASIVNVQTLDALPPVIASLRGIVRQAVPDANAVFIEPDCSGPRAAESISTESIVIRSVD